MRSVKKTVQWTVFSDARVGRVGRQKDEVVALGAQQGLCARRFVRGQVVVREARAATGSRPRRKDLSGFEGRSELVLDIGVEARPVHRAVEHPRGDQAVLGEARDERLCIPVSEGGVVDQAHPDRGPAGGLDEVGLQGRLIDEDQHFQHVGHVRLALLDPDPARFGHVGPQLFAGEQSFFYG